MIQNEAKNRNVVKVTLSDGRTVVIEGLREYTITEDKNFYKFIDTNNKVVFYAKECTVDSVQVIYGEDGDIVDNCTVIEADGDTDDDENDEESIFDLLEEIDELKTRVHNMVAHHE